MNLYQQLGVTQTATNEEIKRAYFRLVRQFTPEKHPDEFMRIRNAYEQLSNEESRITYDESLSRFTGFTGEIAAVIMEAERLGDKGLFDEAIDLLNETLVKCKKSRADAAVVQLALGKMYVNAGNSGKAVKIAEKLVADDPANPEYLSLAFISCAERGWFKKAFAYLEELKRIDPNNDLGTIGRFTDIAMPPEVLGKKIEEVEAQGGKAPMQCINALLSCLLHTRDTDDTPQYEQLTFFSEEDKATKGEQPWQDLLFIADKLVEHTADIKGKQREYIINVLQNDILEEMYEQDRYDILPQIDRVIANTGAEELLKTPEYEVVSVGYEALAAVRNGIPKTLAALSLSRAFSQSEVCGEIDRKAFRGDALTYEVDILLEYQFFKQSIRRFRSEYKKLYSYSADFLDTIGMYNEDRRYDEARKRFQRTKNNDGGRFALEWLGEDDVFEAEEASGAVTGRQEPIRVIKTGRNEPCPCGSGLKYKKCCGR